MGSFSLWHWVILLGLIWVQVIWPIMAASRRKLSGGMFALVILGIFVFPLLSLVLAYALPAGRKPQVMSASLDDLEKAKKLLESGAISRSEYEQIKNRVIGQTV